MSSLTNFTTFVVSPKENDSWLVHLYASGGDEPQWDALFIGECARDRAYAYQHFMNDALAAKARVNAINKQLDAIDGALRNPVWLPPKEVQRD